MKQSALLFLLLLTIGQTTLADIAPVGHKLVAINIQIETEKDFPEYSFYLVSFDGKLEHVEISKDQPTTISGAGRSRIDTCYAKLLAIPKSNEETLTKSEKNDLKQEIAEGKITGAFISKIQFSFHGSISSFDSRSSVTERYRLAFVDAEKGLVLSKFEDESAGNQSFWLIGGALLPLAIISGVFWGFRRKLSRTS